MRKYFMNIQKLYKMNGEPAIGLGLVAVCVVNIITVAVDDLGITKGESVCGMKSQTKKI